MTKKNLAGNLILLLTAMIWGCGFVAQSVGGEIGTFTFNGLRSFVGGTALLIVVLILPLITKKKTKNDKTLVIGGCVCGTVLFIASSCQQYGLNLGVSSGKAGFLTALYVILVPLISVFLKKRLSPFVWVGVLFSLAGLFLLCFGDALTQGMPREELLETLRFSKGELALLLCALMFSFHILSVDYFAARSDCAKLSCIQFFVVGILSVPFALFFEEPSPGAIGNQWLPILYAGAISSGVGYTLQTVGQKMTHPTVASLLMSLESVFSVIFGVLLLHEVHSLIELIGCGLVFCAVIIAQIPPKEKKKA